MAEALATARVDILANTTAFTKSINEAKGTWDKFGKDLAKTKQIIEATFAFKVGEKLVGAIKDIGSAIGELAEKGERAGSIEDAFKKLGGSATEIDKAKKAVLGMVGATDLMQVANQGLLKQIPGFNENFSKIVELGGRMANTLGVDTKEAINQVTAALESGNVKQLQSVGITVKASEAYANYAKMTGLAVDKLDKQQKTEAVQIESTKHLTEAIQRQAEITDSVANAQQAFNVALEEHSTEVGKAINSNETLAGAWRKLTEATEKVDWKGLGDNIARISAIFLDLAVKVLPLVEKEVNNLARGFNYLFGDDALAQADRLADKITKLREAYDFASKRASLSADPEDENRANQIKSELDTAIAAFRKLKPELEETGALEKKVTDQTVQAGVEAAKTGEIKARFGEKSIQQLAAEQKELDKTKAKNDQLRESWEKLLDSLKEDELKKAIEKSIDSVDRSTFDNLKDQLSKQVEDGFVEGQEKAIKAGIVRESDVREIGRRKAAIEAEEYEKKMGDAMQDSVDDWAKSFEDAIEGSSNSFEENFKKIAIGFAAQLAAELFGTTGGATVNGGKGLSGAGGAMAKGIADYFNSGSSSTSFTNSSGETFYGPGGDPSGSGVGQESGGGGMTGASAAGYTQAGMGLFDSWTTKNEKNKQTKSHAGDGEAYGATAGAIIGAYFGGGQGAALGASIGGPIGEMAGGLFGLGHTNPATVAREAMGKFIEDTLRKLSTLAVYDMQGKLKNVRGKDFDFEMGDASRFNPGQPENWADKLNATTKANKSVFVGLAAGLQEVMGITEDVTGQMALMMTEKFGGSIDSARLLVQQLGLSLDEMNAKLVEAGKRGDKTWLEIEVELQGVAEAFKPGLAAMGDVVGAFTELEDSGGRGIAALKGVRDLAVETMEAGGKTLDDLKNKLLMGGVDPEKANAIMQALAQRNIKTLEDLANVSDRVGGGIVADINAASEEMGNTWAEMSAQLEDVAEKMEKLSQDVESNVKINITSDADEYSKKILDATGNNFDVSGFDNSQTADTRMANQSMTRSYANISARSSSTGNTIVINAQNAEAGVEHKIRNVVRQMEDRIVRRSMNSMMDRSARRSD